MTSTATETNVSSTARRGFRRSLAVLIVGGGTALAAILGAGVAAAAPDVVGMSEAQAYQTLENEGVPYITLSRVGAGANCVVANQYDFSHSLTQHGAAAPGVEFLLSGFSGVGLDISCS